MDNENNIIISRPDNIEGWIIDMPELKKGQGRMTIGCEMWKQVIDVLAHWYSIHDYNPQCLLCKEKKK